jgi:hypothetical protein
MRISQEDNVLECIEEETHPKKYIYILFHVYHHQ